jgi:hypothetical protein
MKLLFIFTLFCAWIFFSFSHYIENNNIISSLNNNNNITDIELDHFVENNINSNNSTKFYRLILLNNTEQIFFDYQSEYGCLYINIETDILNINANNYDFTFCSEGINNIFTLNKSEILEKNKNSTKESIIGLNFIIRVGYSSFELDKNFDFDYSLKISLRKPIINIFEIKSEHKILCTPEKTNEEKYRCLFIYDDIQNNNKELIIYSPSTNNIFKTYIFSDYINKSEYDNWNTDYLSNNIPTINSSYNNYNTE